MSVIADTPKPPYYAVIFTSSLSTNTDDYELMAEKMLNLATEQSGFLGFESAREELGITVSYWDSLASISHWKQNSEHQIAQKLGREQWYENYKVRICKIERDYTSGH